MLQMRISDQVRRKAFVSFFNKQSYGAYIKEDIVIMPAADLPLPNLLIACVEILARVDAAMKEAASGR